MAAPEIEERARSQGFRVDARGPERFAPFVADEVARWAAVIKAANITAECRAAPGRICATRCRAGPIRFAPARAASRPERSASRCSERSQRRDAAPQTGQACLAGDARHRSIPWGGHRTSGGVRTGGADAGDELERFGRLHAADDADQRREDAHGRAARPPRTRVRREQAGVAGATRGRAASKTQSWPSKRIAAPETSGTWWGDASAVDGLPRGEVVAAVDHHIGGADQFAETRLVGTFRQRRHLGCRD